MLDCPAEVAAAFGHASRQRLLPLPELAEAPALDAAAIASLIPHRDPFLFLDVVDRVERDPATIACRYDLARAGALVGGHFPARPILPGVVQVEAIGQAGLCLARLRAPEASRDEARPFALTHVLGAVFLRPVAPHGTLEIVVRLFSDGLFHILVGQCVHQGEICCAAALRGLSEEPVHDP